MCNIAGREASPVRSHRIQSIIGIKEDCMAHDRKVVDQIKKCIGRPVSFKFPGDEGGKTGVLRDRAVMISNPRTKGVPYWDVVDLIEFKDEPKPLWIRIGYYRKPNDTLNWGSQTTITEPVDVWKRLLVQTARQKPWFRRLLEDVMSELQA